MTKQYDLIVVGGGPGGLPAAIAAARAGLKTLLIERSATLGGLANSGLPLLGFVDRAGDQVLGGIPQEFVDRLAQVGGTMGHVHCPVHNSLTIINPHWFRIVSFELCREAGVDVLLYAELMDAKTQDDRITQITVLCRGEARTFAAPVFIDATGDACLATRVGAMCRKNEKLQPPSLTFSVGNVNLERFMKYLEEHPESAKLPDTYGVAQTHEQFFRSRAFVYTGFADQIEEAKANGDYTLPRDRIIFTTLGEPGHVLINTTRANGVDTSNYESVLEGEFECHRQIKELMLFFRKYAPGFEDCYLANVSDCLGSRESWRIVGQKSLSAAALADYAIPEDTVTLAGYNVDVHVPHSNKLSIQPVEHAVGIPYGCLVSKNIRNLMVAGRCASIDSDIYGLTRVMGTCMGMGEAAGTAAALAVKQGIEPKDVSVQELKETLLAKGAILTTGKKWDWDK